jgi:hypothetical protein
VNRLSPFVMLALVAATLAGCFYYGPGSSGVISLGPGFDTSGYQTLALRAFDNRAGSFDPSAPVPAGYAINQPLASLTLPWPYQIGGAQNHHSDYSDWIFVAWLSHRTAEDLDGADVDMPDPGDLFCVVPFRLPDTSSGIAPHVDCVLAEVVPASP